MKRSMNAAEQNLQSAVESGDLSWTGQPQRLSFCPLQNGQTAAGVHHQLATIMVLS